MPKNILIISQKGGVGKTMVADEIAYSLERSGIPYCFYDLDGQDNAVHGGHKEDGATVNVIDTPGRLEEDVLGLISQADVVVIPTRPTGDDMKPLVTTMRAVRHHTDAPIVLVVNCMNRFTLARQIVDWIGDGIEAGKLPSIAARALVSQTEMISQARALHKSIVDYKRGSQAAGEIYDMVNGIRGIVGIPTENAMQPTEFKQLKSNGR